MHGELIALGALGALGALLVPKVAHFLQGRCNQCRALAAMKAVPKAAIAMLCSMNAAIITYKEPEDPAVVIDEQESSPSASSPQSVSSPPAPTAFPMSIAPVGSIMAKSDPNLHPRIHRQSLFR